METTTTLPYYSGLWDISNWYTNVLFEINQKLDVIQITKPTKKTSILKDVADYYKNDDSITHIKLRKQLLLEQDAILYLCYTPYEYGIGKRLTKPLKTTVLALFNRQIAYIESLYKIKPGRIDDIPNPIGRKQYKVACTYRDLMLNTDTLKQLPDTIKSTLDKLDDTYANQL